MNEWLLLSGMMLVTFVPRLLPIALAGRFRIHPVMQRALEFVPIAVLSAIISTASLVHDGAIDLALDNPYLYGLAGAAIIAWITKSTFKTIIVGLMFYALAFAIIGTTN